MNRYRIPGILRTTTLVLAATIFFTAGCGKGSDGQQEVLVKNSEPMRQELVRGSLAEPTSLDPQIGFGNEVYIQRDLHEGLVTVGSNGEVLPAVAERWESHDNLVYTFFLRHDAQWSNGDPVTAHDFVFSWRRLVAPETGSLYGWYLGGAGIENAKEINRGDMPIESLGVTALDNHTLQVKLAEPVAYFIDMLTHTSTFPLHAATIRKYGDSWAKLGSHVGNGPFKLSDWVVNERIELEPNKHYWDRESITLEKVTFLPISDAGAELQRYLAGELDITYQVPENQISRLLEMYPEQLQLDPFLGTRFILFNTNKPPFNDARLRKALTYALDRQVITQKVKRGGEVPSFSLVPPGHLGGQHMPTTWANWNQTEREERARTLYAEAGFSQEEPLRITYLGGGHLSTAIAAMWKRVLGVETKLETQEFRAFLKTLERGDFQVAGGVWWGDYNEPSTMLKLMLTDGGTNFSGYSNSEFDALMHTSKHTSGRDDRAELYAKAEAILAEDMPIGPIFQFTSARLVKPHVGGYAPHPLNYLNSKNLWLRTSGESEKHVDSNSK